jgi:hypothetical protein
MATSEEEIFFRLIRGIQILGILLSLQKLGLYVEPHSSMFSTIDFRTIIQKLANRDLMFVYLVRRRQFKKSFGQYSYIILKLCSLMSLNQSISYVKLLGARTIKTQF